MSGWGFAITGALFGEFLQHAEIAASFEAFFRLYSGWREKLALAPILSGRQSGCAPELQELSFDGRLAAVEFLLHAVRRELEDYRQSAALCGSLESFVSALQQEADPLRAAKENLSRREKAVQLRQELGVLPPGEQARERHLAQGFTRCWTMQTIWRIAAGSRALPAGAFAAGIFVQRASWTTPWALCTIPRRGA